MKNSSTLVEMLNMKVRETVGRQNFKLILPEIDIYVVDKTVV